jgi:hypothetical protein
VDETIEEKKKILKNKLPLLMSLSLMVIFQSCTPEEIQLSLENEKDLQEIRELEGKIKCPIPDYSSEEVIIEDGKYGNCALITEVSTSGKKEYYLDYKPTSYLPGTPDTCKLDSNEIVTFTYDVNANSKCSVVKEKSNNSAEIKKLMAELDEVVGKVKDAIANIEGARKNRDDKKVSEYLDSYESYKAYAIKVSANISDLERSKKVYDQLQVAIKEYDSRAYAHTSDEVKKLTSELQAHLGKAEDTVTIFEAARAKGDEKTAASYLNSYEGAREGALKVAEEISKIEGTTKVYDEVKEAINNYDSRVKTPAPSEEIKKLMAELEEHILKTQYTLKDIEASRAKGDDKAISSLLRTYETVKKYALDTSKKISDKKFLEVENDFKGYDSKAYASDSKAAKR